jgi:7-cyano-7-deazaguanine synthase
MAKDLAIVLNNGSINSAVATALAAQKFRPVLLYAETASPALSRARAAYDHQVAHFKPYREHVLGMPFLAGVQQEATSMSLAADTRQGTMLARHLADLLPLVATAGRFAAHYQAAAVYLGLRVGPAGDEMAQASEYVQVFNELLQLPCGQSDLEVVAPLLELEGWQVIDVGFQVNAPLDRTWSCLEQTDDPCWSCRGCRAREQAFVQSGKPDPLKAGRK